MDGKNKSGVNEHESTSQEPKEADENKVFLESKVVKSFQKLLDHENQGPAKETKLNIEAFEAGVDVDLNLYEAGPSRIHLPGAIQQSPKPKLHQRLSKSEHSIPQLITSKDVAEALKLTSLSFATGKHTPVVTNLNLKDLKIPTVATVECKPNGSRDACKADSKTMVDLKNFMASGFKLSKEASIHKAPQVSVHKITVTHEVQEKANTSAEPVPGVTVQTENEVMKNDVIVTKPPVEPKASKDSKKKGTGSLSERSDLGLATRDSLSSIGSNVCRICMTRGRERLISPCNCKGSLANVHLSCLERWLNQVGRNHCELCGFSYPAIRTPRYTVLQALRLWFGNPRNRSHLQSDCLIFWLLSTVTAGLLAVCIVGTQYFVIEGNKFGKLDAHLRKEEGISHRITETAMDFFMAIVLCGYSVTVYLLWKDHYVMWNRWRRANVNVRLLLSQDAEPVPFVPRQQRYFV